MGVSRRSYAAQRGVSEAAVRKAIATGRITTLPDGTIDPARAHSEWGAQTDPAKQRGQHARQMGAETAAGTARAAATKPVPQAAIRAVADTLRDAGTDPGKPRGDGWRGILPARPDGQRGAESSDRQGPVGEDESRSDRPSPGNGDLRPASLAAALTGRVHLLAKVRGPDDVAADAHPPEQARDRRASRAGVAKRCSSCRV